jgi:hypothetical protein
MILLDNSYACRPDAVHAFSLMATGLLSRTTQIGRGREAHPTADATECPFFL